MSLQAFKDALSVAATGITKADAHKQGVCVRCKRPPTFHTAAGEREYGISGMCEPCWEVLFADEE